MQVPQTLPMKHSWRMAFRDRNSRAAVILCQLHPLAMRLVGLHTTVQFQFDTVDEQLFCSDRRIEVGIITMGTNTRATLLVGGAEKFSKEIDSVIVTADTADTPTVVAALCAALQPGCEALGLQLPQKDLRCTRITYGDNCGFLVPTESGGWIYGVMADDTGAVGGCLPLNAPQYLLMFSTNDQQTMDKIRESILSFTRGAGISEGTDFVETRFQDTLV